MRVLYVFGLFLWLLCNQHEVSGDSLYSPDDPITTLTVHNFENTLRNSDTAWVVEYYATWCGHCQRFAPFYRAFAEDIEGWSKVIKVGAVACSDPQNLPVCRNQHIRGYPSVKFYPAQMRTLGRGYKFNGLRFNSESLRDITLSFVSQYRNPSGPPVSQYRSVSELQQHASSVSAQNIFAIVEDDRAMDSSLSQYKMVILDLSTLYPDTVVGRLPKSAIRDEAVRRQSAPILLAINRLDSSIRIIGRISSRENAVQRIKADLRTSRPSQPEAPVITRPPYTPSTLPPLRTALLPERTTTTPLHHATPVDYSSKLHHEDLDSNIYYMLWNEVAARNRITGRALPALKEYIRILSKYYPGNERLHSFINSVNRWLQRLGGSLDGQLYLNTLDGLQMNDSYVVKELDWKSCAGTEQQHGASQYRGYPCSLWMTFHALTVAAYDSYLSNPGRYFTPMEVLGAIRNYVQYYLGCRECAGHFTNMARSMVIEAVRPEDVILWLWKAHNKVNNRLSGDETEDPAHPKIQFPSPATCPSCRNGNGPFDKFNNETSWNETEVLRFLRHFYSKDNIMQNDQPMTQQEQLGGTDHEHHGNEGHLQHGNTRHPSSHNDGAATNHGHHHTGSHTTGVSATSDACAPEETTWSSCSATCGVGVSTRLSNNNTRCEMQMEMRLCQLRPCDFNPRNYNYRSRSRNHCATYLATQQESSHTPLSFHNCTTVNSYRWHYCGLCPGYCCEPISDGTFWADITCNDQQRGQVQVAWLGRCACRPC